MKLKTLKKDYSVQEMQQNQLLSSVETVLSIDDLLMEILLRLPAESMLRFKLVSKHWYSVITSPEFSLLHRRKPAAATGILYLHHNFVFNGIYNFAPLSIENPASPPFRKLKFTDDPLVGIRINQACNGLLLCSSFKMVSESGEYQDFVVQYFVCNPTTKRFITLPGLEAREISSSSWIQGMSLAFDPAKSPHYKAVCVSCFTSQFQIEVYSSETKCWSKSGEIFTAESDFGKHGVYWNGAIHWICNAYKDLRYYRVDDETLHMMPMPPLLPTLGQRSACRLVESCDHLHWIEAKQKYLGVQLRLYEIRRDHSEWFVKYYIDLLPHIEPYRRLYLFTLVRNKNKEEDDAYLVLGTIGKVVRYDLLKKTCQVCCESYVCGKGYELEHSLPIGLRDYNGPKCIEFIESLCSV